MSALLPPGQIQFIDGNGVPYAGGQVYFYVPNTTQPKTTWQDQAQTILNTNPVILDGSGRATIWGDGDYRQVLRDANNNTIWDKTVSASLLYLPKFTFIGTPTSSQVIGLDYVVSNASFPAAFEGSRFGCLVAPLGPYTILVQVNGITVGSIIFGANARIATFATLTNDPVQISDDDVLQLVAPVTTDTIYGIYGTLKGTR